MKHAVVSSFASLVLGATAVADLTGFTATRRQVSGGFLINVYATTNASTDVILNVSGGSVGLPTAGYIRTNSPGGFRRGTGSQSVFAPSGSQNWTTLDSFLTVGGGFNTTTNAWLGNGATQGDPPWNVTYTDTDTGEATTVSSFNTQDNASGFTNPNTSSIPATAGWLIAGSTSPARSLASVASIRLPHQVSNGINFGATSPAAATATVGFHVAQLYVAQSSTPSQPSIYNIEWKMSATLRRPDGSTSNASYTFVIGSGDSDGDGVPDLSDPCPTVPGPCGGCPLNACGTCGTAADVDGDGIPDCLDNCPSVSNPAQADCNGNGIGDACENLADCNQNGIPDPCDIAAGGAALDCNSNGILDSCEIAQSPGIDCNLNGIIDSCDLATGFSPDCNSNGVPDSCELASGTVPDCNANGIPDACDITSGTSNDVDGNGIPDDCKPDCNGNGLPDPWEVATGRVPDCNNDQIPDTCQGAVSVDSTSPDLGAPSGTEAREFTFDGLPFAATAVTLTLDVRGDLGGQTEFVEVVVNGGSPRRFFVADGDDCPNTPDRATLTWTAQEFNALTAGMNALTVRMTCPTTVDPTECKGAGSTAFQLAYFGIGPKGDCDGNRGLDICDIASGTPDCNGNSIPDSCDIARGLLPDCNGNGVPDPCELAANPALDCNGNRIPDSCDLVTGGLAVDCDGNGRIDSCQVVEDPAVDCNGNGKPDSCDIAAGGLSVDCDANGRLDSCQVVEDPAVDCNGNGKPDSCDIAGGNSLDIDGNGLPDECQTVRVPLEIASIQAAIDSAPTSQMRIIAVDPGIYPGPIDFSGKPVIVRGSDAAATIIQGGGSGKSAVVRFTGGEPAIAALERVTVRGGTSGSQPPGMPYFAGGGIFGRQSAASVRHCIIEGNSAGVGGGVYLENCSSHLFANVIRLNGAASDGGGLATIGGSVQISGCTVESNVADGRGGGLHLRGGQPMLMDTVVRDNACSTVAAGICWISGPADNAYLSILDSQVTGNVAGIAQGGIGIQGAAVAPRISLVATTVCTNTPRPNVEGDWVDLGGNTICTCVGDLNDDDRVSGDDLGALLAAWGPCIDTPCPADLNRDLVVDADDLGALLANWGPCAP
jgi:hypothetical protein